MLSAPREETMTVRHSIQKVTQGGAEWWQHTMSRMVRCRTVAALLDLAYDAIRGGLGYDHVGVFLADPARGVLVEHLATDKTGQKVYPPDRIFPLDDGFYGRLLSDMRMRAEGVGFVVWTDTTDAADVTDAANVTDAAVLSIVDDDAPSTRLDAANAAARTLYVALRTPDEVLGMIAIANRGDRRPVTAADALSPVALATALALALRNITLSVAHTRAGGPAPAPGRQGAADTKDAGKRESDEAAQRQTRARVASPEAPRGRTRDTAAMVADALHHDALLVHLDGIVAERHCRVLRSLVAAIDAKDRYTREHSEDTMRLALLLAEAIELNEDQRRILALAGLLHDIGKIAVPDHVLRKPGKLTREEYETLKHHVSFGVAIIQGVLHDTAVIDAVAHHHERWDGLGYPKGIAGPQAPLLGRIMQIADAVSAMRLHRPYRQALPWARITAELRGGAGAQFDPDLIEPFVRAVGRLSTSS